MQITGKSYRLRNQARGKDDNDVATDAKPASPEGALMVSNRPGHRQERPTSKIGHPWRGAHREKAAKIAEVTLER